MPEDYDADGSHALSPHRSTYRPVFYSYTLGRKKIPQTIDYDDLERAVHFVEQFISIVSMKSKRLYDSVAVWRYQVKREMLGKLAEMCEDAVGLGASYSGETFANNKAYAVNALVRSKSSGEGIEYGIIVKPVKSGDFSNWAGAVAGGAIIVYNGLVEELKKVFPRKCRGLYICADPYNFEKINKYKDMDDKLYDEIFNLKALKIDDKELNAKIEELEARA